MSTEESGNESGHCSSHSSDSNSPVAAVQPFVNGVNATIHEAARKGDIAAVRALLDKGERIESRDSHGNTPLHIAVQSNRLEAVKFLLERGAKLSARGPYRNTSLHLAADLGTVDILQYLINSGADVNLANSRGQTPLLLACMRRDLECVKLLLGQGADIHRSDTENISPLMYCCWEGFDEIVDKLLLDKLFHWKQYQLKDPLKFAAKKGHLRICAILILKGASFNSEDAQAILAAKLTLKLLEILFQTCADLSQFRSVSLTLLNKAAAVGDDTVVWDILEFLPEGTVPTDSLRIAAAKGHVNFIKVLFDAFGSKAFYNNNNVLCEAALAGHLKCIQMFVEAGFDVNKYSYKCTTDNYDQPLQCAARGGNVECLRELIKAGAKVDEGHDTGYKTPLHIAAECGHKECVEELLSSGAKHLLWGDKYPHQVAKTTEIRDLLQKHKKEHQ